MLTYNSCRKFLPTACNISRFDFQPAQAVGRTFKGDGDESHRIHTVPFGQMSVHCADELARASGFAKESVLAAFVDSAAAFPGVQDILLGSNKLLPANGLTWEMLGAQHASTSTSASSSSRLAQEVCSQKPHCEEGKKRKKDKKDKKRRRSPEPDEPTTKKQTKSHR